MRNERIRILAGPLEPIIREALIAACAKDLEIFESPYSGRRLIAQARSKRVTAVIAMRKDMIDLCGSLPSDVLVIGLSTSSWTALVASGRHQIQMTNPSPESIASLIRAWEDLGKSVVLRT